VGLSAYEHRQVLDLVICRPGCVKYDLMELLNDFKRARIVLQLAEGVKSQSTMVSFRTLLHLPQHHLGRIYTAVESGHASLALD